MDSLQDNRQSEMCFHAEVIMPLIRERLSAGQVVRNLGFQGVSMLPMLRQGKDCVELASLPERLKKYDLPLYQRKNGQFVLHRVVEAGETYTCLGDNQFDLEPGLDHKQMIAVVTSFTRGNREIPVTAWHYRLYCRIWYHCRHIRRFCRRGKNWLRRHLK